MVNGGVEDPCTDYCFSVRRTKMEMVSALFACFVTLLLARYTKVRTGSGLLQPIWRYYLFVRSHKGIANVY